MVGVFLFVRCLTSDSPYSQNVAECTNSASELLKKKDSDAAGKALELISKALSISLYSETLLQMKAEALYLVCFY